MKPLNDQEFFDTVYQHLVDQGVASLNVDMQCAYRGVDGLKCAIGAVMPDELYNPQFDIQVMGVSSLPTRVTSAMFKNNLLASKLQGVHDADSSWNNGGFSKGGHNRMMQIAVEHSLTYKKPKKKGP